MNPFFKNLSVIIFDSSSIVETLCCANGLKDGIPHEPKTQEAASLILGFGHTLEALHSNDLCRLGSSAGGQHLVRGLYPTFSYY